MAWKQLSRSIEIALYLGVGEGSLKTARRQRAYIYIKRVDRRGKKPRDLCYPPRKSVLRTVQEAVRAQCLDKLELSRAVRGYRKKQHNINCAQLITGYPFVGKVDLKDFHPSIRPDLLMVALLWHGLSNALARIITQICTFEHAVPQGATTSNHVANIIIDYILRQGVLRFCADHGVIVLNFGDDTAFAGYDRRTVDECVEFAKGAFGKYGFVANSKSATAQHVGGDRKFLGVSTARANVDVPRKKYREYRHELLKARALERDPTSNYSATPTEMRSFRAKMAYVRRMSPKKYRKLAEIFYRLCRIKRDKIKQKPPPQELPICRASGEVDQSPEDCPFDGLVPPRLLG